MGLAEIDKEKLRSLGVPEEVIETMNPEDGGNITPQGEVLFLDEQRQKQKENLDKPLRKNKPDRLGVRNKMADTISKKATGSSDPPVKMFDLIVNAAKWPENSVKSKIFQRMMGLDDKGYTGGTVFPLNHNLSEDSSVGIIPIDHVYSALEEANYIAVLNMCICRTVYDCKDYPKELGCIFLNVAGERAVQNGIGRQVTVEEAKAHVQWAKRVGLAAHAEMQEIEQYVWGLHSDEMNEFRMICFCCPCCCVAFNLSKNGSDSMKSRYTSCGYTTTVNHDKCVGCHNCESICPKQAISYREDGKCRIDQDRCFGCGFCKEECSSGALTLQQTFPMRENIDEYFLKEFRIDDGLEHYPTVKHSDR